MKNRAAIIFILTHAYPLFVVGHLCFGDWCRLCQVLFNCCPIAVFGGLFLVWENSSQTPLNGCERFNLRFLVYMILVIYSYYMICIFSLPKWVFEKNVQMAGFVILTTIFYLLFYRRFKQNAPR